MPALVSVRDLVKAYGGRLAVDHVSFEVAEGEVFGLLGPNGAGKTTTLRILCTLLRPTAGAVFVAGLAAGRDDVAIRAQVGLLTEQPGLYDRLSGLDNLRYFVELCDADRKAAEARIEKYLTRFGLWDRRHDKAGAYSKGMRQKLSLVRALVHGPRAVFLDEPTSALDPEAALTVRDTVTELAAEGCAVVVCTHNLAEAERLCQRVGILKTKLVAVGEVGRMLGVEASVTVEFDGPAEPWLEAARGWDGTRLAALREGALRVALADARGVPDLVGLLVSRGARIRSVVPEHRALEEAYLELVRNGDEQDPDA